MAMVAICAIAKSSKCGNMYVVQWKLSMEIYMMTNMYNGKMSMDPADSLHVSMTPSSCLESKDSCSCSLKVYWTATITGAIGALGGNIYNVQQ